MKDESKLIFPIFYKEFCGDNTISEYFIEIVDCFICLLSNIKEHFLAEKDEFNSV
jgi:hypothetical protein